MYSEGPLRFPILLVDGATFQRWEALDYAMLAFSCGILVGLAIYLGFMWRALRESHLAWLGLMALCLFASLVSSYNLMAEFVTPMLQPSARLAGLGFGYATIACGNLFVIAFLDLRRLDRRLWLVAWAICLACAAMTVVAIFDARVGRVGVALLGLLTGVCDLAALVLGARRRVPHAWALLLAWLPGHVGTGVLHVIALSIPVPVEITGNMGYAGAMLATLMMTIVAIDRQRSRREGVARALRESETRFRDFASAASDWLWETDAGLCYTYFGGGAMTAIGFEPARALGKTPGELLDLHPAENPAALWRDVGERKAFRNIVFGFRRGAGGRGYLSVSGVPIHDDAGVFRGYRGVATDVTDAVLGEDARRRREKLAALGQLAGGMAHELNNLLHPILNFAGEAARAVPDTMPATRRYLGIVADCARKAADIVSRVLAFARGEAARSEPTDLAGAVVDALVLADALLPPETTIRREIDRAAGTARVAPAEVTQVILNLVTNAAQAMPAGGTIGVSLARASRGDGRASASLVVTDQGRGIEASVKARLFEPFFTTRAGAGGTGLGLSVVYGIVQGWGGDIAVDNGRDGGARVAVEIPLMEAT